MLPYNPFDNCVRPSTAVDLFAVLSLFCFNMNFVQCVYSKWQHVHLLWTVESLDIQCTLYISYMQCVKYVITFFY